MATSSTIGLPAILIFLVAAVVAVPVFKRLGLSAILGYLAAGIIMGPSGLQVIEDPTTVLHIAEFGVVLLLFVIGLELRPGHLLAMRRDIFGLGALQMGVTTLLIAAGLVFLLKYDIAPACVLAFGLSMASTAIALQIMDDRGHFAAPYARRSFSVLIFQDIMVVPLLMLVPILATSGAYFGNGWNDTAVQLLKVAGAVAFVILFGRFGLNPLFQILARTGTREVMTAAALLVVLGTASLMQWAGVSMALGAFLAGVMLAESDFRVQLEADIEPFRGLLLGLFFMSVGMNINADLLVKNWLFLSIAAPGLLALKLWIARAALRLTGSDRPEAWRAASMLAPGSEFAFVLFPLAATTGLVSTEVGALFTMLAAMMMLLGTPLISVVERLMPAPVSAPALIDSDFSDARGSVLMIGFGRFGQIACQVLHADHTDVTIIEHDVDMIKQAQRFGFKVYYGDGRRLDVLRAAGAVRARVICVTMGNRDDSNALILLLKKHFPQAKIFAQAYDRQHALGLIQVGVDYQIRETVESALVFGRAALEALGTPPARAAEVEQSVRQRDLKRLKLQIDGGLYAGKDLIHTPRVVTAVPLDED